METHWQRLFDWMSRSRFRGKRLVIIAMAVLFVASIPLIFLFVVVPAFIMGFVSQGMSRTDRNKDSGSRAAQI